MGRVLEWLQVGRRVSAHGVPWDFRGKRLVDLLPWFVDPWTQRRRSRAWIGARSWHLHCQRRSPRSCATWEAPWSFSKRAQWFRCSWLLTPLGNRQSRSRTAGLQEIRTERVRVIVLVGAKSSYKNLLLWCGCRPNLSTTGTEHA